MLKNGVWTVETNDWSAQESGSLSVVKSRVFGSVSSGSVVLSEVREYPAS